VVVVGDEGVNEGLVSPLDEDWELARGL
jgi:hypothetical protein